MRDLLAYYDLWERHRILHGGLAELIVNAMADVQPGFVQWEWRKVWLTACGVRTADSFGPIRRLKCILV
jgi:hypothetical protein